VIGTLRAMSPSLRTLAAAPLLVLTLSGMLTGCGSDDADLCAKALDTAGFVPDLSNPSAAVTQAMDKADQLRALAGRTTDDDLQRELRATADRLSTLRESDVNPVDAAEWAGRQVEQVERLRQACA
jgi:hypothetical protein